jgi:hypothetical protein
VLPASRPSRVVAAIRRAELAEHAERYVKEVSKVEQREARAPAAAQSSGDEDW